MAKKLIELDGDVLEKIFLMLSVDDIEICTQVCREWSNFIHSCIYSQTKVKNRRIDRNWSQVDPKYVQSSEFLPLNLQKPFIIKATDKFVVVQEYNNLHQNDQQFFVFDLENKHVWTTPIIGPAAPVDVQRYHRLWKDYIRVQVFVNQDVFCIIFGNREKKNYYKLMVWSSVTHKKIYDATIGNYCGALFFEDKSTLVVFQANKLETLIFGDKAFISRHSCVNSTPLKKPKIGAADNYNISAPYLLFWQSTTMETRLYMWIYDDLKLELKQFRSYQNFKQFANIEVQYQLMDALYLSDRFVLLTHTHNLPRITNLKIVNDNGTTIQQIAIGRYLANTGLLYNERKLFVKTFKFVNEVMMMFDLKELFDVPLGTEVTYNEINDLKLKNMAYLYYQHYHPEGGRESGCIMNKNFIGKI